MPGKETLIDIRLCAGVRRTTSVKQLRDTDPANPNPSHPTSDEPRTVAVSLQGIWNCRELNEPVGMELLNETDHDANLRQRLFPVS